jgi:prepilin-type N-terminal cleavage/methylation domain-containing protein/prepilin-type processing-associated H-X9-DG protein
MVSLRRSRVARGFTLVELLVVIVVIGLLAGLSVPAIGRAQASARTAQCASNMRQIVQGLLQWSANNETYLPCFVTSVSNSPGYYWYAEVSRNANTPGGTTLPYCGHNPLLKGESASTVWICPANNPFKSKLATTKDCSYGINGKAVPNSPGSSQVKMVNITKPSRCVAITDWNLKSGNQNKITADADMATPHNNGMNIAFWDSHVEYTNAIPSYTNAIFSR